MIGTVLSNRYEILSEVGSGGMAKVYKAKCRYLQRIVAVKVLKEEFREDTEFLQRFDTEAQAAASLTHPNIVQIYDVGRDNNRYFIVMEYVEGITLKEYIEERGKLEWREAINISIQICSALSKAHSRHIIHRDIKPHNIIMNSDGVPKVADFGIARSVSSETATMKIDTVGSVHYSSPEQVRGGYTDEKSDIYSIGVTIFEMVTGKLPFDGETPVAIALQHIQDEPPSPSSLNPGIPQALDHIILKCMAKSRQDRYDSVTELINDLENIRFINGATDIVLPNVKHEGDKFSTKKFEKLGDEELSKSNRANSSSSNKKKPEAGGSNRLLMGLLYFTLIAVILGGIGYFVKAVLGDIGIIADPDQKPQEYVLGRYVSRDIEEVKAELELAGITPEIVYEFNEDVDENVIISQSPPPDTDFKIGGMTPLKLVVSKGENLVEIPKVKYEEHNTLKFKLQDELGLVVEEKSEYSEEVGSNYVIRSDPEPGTQVKRGTKITIYWSLGPEKKQVVVPDLNGYTYEQAVNKLLAMKLKLGKTFPEGREGYKGKIVDQAPKAGTTVTEDSAIDIFFEDNITETGGGSGGQQTGTTNKTIVVDLPGGYDFGESVQLRGLVVDNSTGEEYALFNETVKTGDFPYPVVVPVPTSGGVTFKIYVNDILVNENTY